MSLFKTITDKPWERKGVIGDLNAEGSFESPPERVALVFFWWLPRLCSLCLPLAMLFAWIFPIGFHWMTLLSSG